MQCQESFEYVSVSTLLFGLDWRTQGQVLLRIDQLEKTVVGGQETIIDELKDMRQHIQR